MIVSLWEGQAEYDSWAEATLLHQIDLPGGMDGRPEQRKGLWWITTPCCLPAEWLGPRAGTQLRKSATAAAGTELASRASLSNNFQKRSTPRSATRGNPVNPASRSNASYKCSGWSPPTRWSASA